MTILLSLGISGLGNSPLMGQTRVIAQPEIDLGTLKPKDVLGTDKFQKVPEHIHVVRSIDPLWLFEISNEHLPQVTSEYSVIGANGKPGVFTNLEDPSSFISVEIRPKGICYQESVNDHWLMSEAIDIDLDPLPANSKGKYSGTITATVTVLNI